MSRRVCVQVPPDRRGFVRSLLIAVAALSLTGCAHRQPTAPAQPLRVLVYNIHAGKDAAGADNLERVASLIAQTGADISLLQEVDRGTERSGRVDQLAELARLTGQHGAFGRTLDYQGGEYGIAVLSRWRILSDSMIPLPVVPRQERAGGSYEPRGALHVTVDHPGGRLHVLDTHLDPGRDPHYRRQEIAGVMRALEHVMATGAPVLFGGDLNATPDDSAIASLAGSGLRDAWTACNTMGTGFTFSAAAPVKRIDYLWIPSDASCAEGTVLTTDASDHLPLLVTLTLGSGSPPP